MSKTVAVLMGGTSAEREVSLVTGKACAEALREAGYQVVEIDVGRDVAALVEALTPAPDAVFNALHGRWGEDGCVQFDFGDKAEGASRKRGTGASTMKATPAKRGTGRASDASSGPKKARDPRPRRGLPRHRLSPRRLHARSACARLASAVTRATRATTAGSGRSFEMGRV